MNEAEKLLKYFDRAGRMDERLQRRYEKELISLLSASLKEVKAQIALVFEKYGDSVSYAEMQAYNRLKNLEQSIGEELAKMGKKANGALKEAIKAQFIQAHDFVGYAFENSVQVGIGFSVLKKTQIDAALLNPLDRIGWPVRFSDHINVLNKRIRQRIAQGLIQGKGYTAIARETSLGFSKTATQTKRIIRTEMHRVQTAGRLEGISKAEKAAERLKIEVYRQLVAVRDDRTRDQSLQVDGNRARKSDGLFKYPDGNYYDGPGMTGVAEWDINDREQVIMGIEEIPRKLRREEVEADFEEWQNRL